MKMPYPIQPARRDIPNGYEVDYASRDLIPLPFRYVVYAVIGIPSAALFVFAICHVLAQIPR